MADLDKYDLHKPDLDRANPIETDADKIDLYKPEDVEITAQAHQSEFSPAPEDQDIEEVSQTPTTFRHFRDLPLEVREIVWKFVANEPRNLPIVLRPLSRSSYPDITPGWRYKSHTPVPAILHTNTESRNVGLKYFELSLGQDFFMGAYEDFSYYDSPSSYSDPSVESHELTVSTKPRIYINWITDTLVILNSGSELDYDYILQGEFWDDFKRARCVALEMDCCDQSYGLPTPDGTYIGANMPLDVLAQEYLEYERGARVQCQLQELILYGDPESVDAERMLRGDEFELTRISNCRACSNEYNKRVMKGVSTYPKILEGIAAHMGEVLDGGLYTDGVLTGVLSGARVTFKE